MFINRQNSLIDRFNIAHDNRTPLFILKRFNNFQLSSMIITNNKKEPMCQDIDIFGKLDVVLFSGISQWGDNFGGKY